ncbi:MAG: hypothetical protein NE327_15465 [Lentisphaeraceae bacterium]|nr:hypothetical protein [Lentisphaeraceae bacterium]
MQKLKKENVTISQDEIDDLLTLADFIESQDEKNKHSLIDELKYAILDSGKLKLTEWNSLRRKLREIEELIPHIDLIIRLKEQREFMEKAKTNR